MPECIDRDILFEQIRLTANRSCLGETSVAEISAMEIVNVIANMPVADVEPVKHGEWICMGDCGVTKCSCCGWTIEEYIEDKYCRECGAKMDGEIND